MAKAINLNDVVPSANEAESYERAKVFLSGWIEDSLLVPPARTRPPQHRRLFSQSSDVPLPTGRLRRSVTDNINSLANSLHTSIMLHEHQNQNRPTQHRSMADRPNVSPTCVGRALQKVPSSGGGCGAIPPLPFSKRPQQPSTSSSGSGGDRRRRSCENAPSEHVKNKYKCKSNRRRSCDDAPSGYVHSKSSKTDADNVGHADELIQPRASRDALSNTTTSSPKAKGSAVPSTVRALEKDVSPSRKSGGGGGGERRRKSWTLNRPSTTKSAWKKSRRHTVDTEGSPSTTTNKLSSLEAPLSLDLDHLSELDGPNFDLGDTFRSPKYQIVEGNTTKAENLVKQLRIHDFAWVRRSSHEWTYGIVADFPKPKHGEEASILFVVDKLGHTKSFKMKHWATCIRLVDDK